MKCRGAAGLATLALSLLAVRPALAAEEGGEHVGTWLNWLFKVKVGGHPVVSNPAELAFAWAVVLVIALMAAAVIGSRRLAVRPGPFQTLLETAVGALQSVIEGVMGPKGKDFLPFIGSIFIYVFLMNLMGIIPGFLSPTSNLSITAAMAVSIFVVVQFYGFKESGFGYLKHFLEGLPPPPSLRTTALPWYVVQLLLLALMGAFIFAVHLIGEFVRPVSLSLRLFGNIAGEEAIVLTLVTLVAATRLFWIPVQLPNLALGLLTAFVQALVMSLLAAVYLSGVVPHASEAERLAHG